MLESLLVLSLFRIGFIFWLWPRVAAVNGLWPVLGYGVRFDLLLICYVLALPVVFSLLLPDISVVQKFYRRMETLWLSLWFGFFIYMETATPSFVNQYDTRPDRIFYEYLLHPKEVFGTLWGDYKLQLLLGFVLLLLAVGFSLRMLQQQAADRSRWRLRWRLLAFPLCALLLFLGARSSLGHRPANISTAAFSNDQMVNRLGVSSTYSMLYAVSNISNEGHAERIYQKMPAAEMISRLHRYMGLPDSDFPLAAIPTFHRQEPAQILARPRNVVIILEESLGADFVGSLGGKNWTQELDRLHDQGIWFEKLYSTGTRSVRGIEATTTGFLPSPGRSVVTLGLSQQHFFYPGPTLPPDRI